MEEVAVVSGGFDPLHAGHIRLILAARTIVQAPVWIILNNDSWLKSKKGFTFMGQNERAEILHAIKGVERVVITWHTISSKDTSVCETIQAIDNLFPTHKFTFCNGGDRLFANTPEVELCKKLGWQMRWNVGGEKIQSSSSLVEEAKECLTNHQKEYYLGLRVCLKKHQQPYVP